MTLSELHRNFKLELDKPPISAYPSFLEEEIDYWINTAILRTIKTRYSGLNAHQKGFQQDQKRTDDLRMATKVYDYTVKIFSSGTKYYVKDIILGPDGDYYISDVEHTASDLSLLRKITNYPGSLDLEFPSDYMILVGETVNIYSNDSCWPKISGTPKRKRGNILEATIENIDSQLENSLSEHRLHGNRAKPIRVISENKIKVFTDGSYFIDKYSIEYIHMPEKLDWYNYVEYEEADAIPNGTRIFLDGFHYICKYNKPALDPIDKTKLELIHETAVPDHLWDEVVVLAVRLALQNISEPRYQTYSQESQFVE